VITDKIESLRIELEGVLDETANGRFVASDFWS